MLLLKLCCLAICFCGGITFHRWAARRWFGATDSLGEQELLLHGLPAAIIINGAAGTGLALLHLFYLPAFTLLFAACLAVLRADAAASWQAARSLAHDIGRELGGLRPLSWLATACWLGLAAVLALLSRIPTTNLDAWVFHLPLAASMVEHHGFIYPQIGHVFYASQPLFVNVLFAQALLIDPDFISASLVNVLIFLFTLVSLAAVWAPRRATALLLLTLAIGASPFFSSMVAIPTTDMARSCLSALSLVFALLYFERRVPYYAGLGAACVGAAIATKYTEGVTLILFCACLLAAQWRRPDPRLLAKCGLIVALIAAYWYLKNLILLGNPLYPFLFGHAGLSDAWMADYMIELKQTFDPALRHFSHEMLTLQGWRDFLLASWQLLFERRPVAVCALLAALAGAAAAPRRLLPLLGLTLVLLVFWYVAMFNHVRWAITAYMLLHIAGCRALMVLLQKFRPDDGAVQAPVPRSQARRVAISGAVAVGGLLLLFAWQGERIGQTGRAALSRVQLPKAIEPVAYAALPGGLESYLARTRPGYRLYRRIITEHLTGVYQPYDLGVKRYAATFANGLDGNWFVDIYDTPAQLESADAFIQSHGIRYFITRNDLTALDRERLVEEKLSSADRIVGQLRPGARLIAEDENGWRLYQSATAASR